MLMMCKWRGIAQEKANKYKETGVGERMGKEWEPAQVGSVKRERWGQMKEERVRDNGNVEEMWKREREDNERYK